MPEKRLPMRQIREVLRLHFEAKLNERQIAKICSVGKGTVRRYLKRIAVAGLAWPIPAEVDDAALEQRMFPPPPPAAPGSRPLPDFTVVHKELKSRQSPFSRGHAGRKTASGDGLSLRAGCDQFKP